MAGKSSVREYAILYVGGKKSGGGAVGGGNVLLNAGQHALGGPEHTGQLPIERLSTTEIDGSLVMSPNGTGGVAFVAPPGSFVPYYIAPGETFTVPVYKQALYSMLIDNAGTLVVDGHLLEVT